MAAKKKTTKKKAKSRGGRDGDGRFREGHETGKGTRFKKGVSGNPGGREKIPESIKKLAKEKSEEALRTIIEIMRSAEKAVSTKMEIVYVPDYPTRLRAAEYVLDRAWGKPAQAITGEEGGPVNIKAEVLTDDQLATIATGGTLTCTE
jgi:hypothetical protein